MNEDVSESESGMGCERNGGCGMTTNRVWRGKLGGMICGYAESDGAPVRGVVQKGFGSASATENASCVKSGDCVLENGNENESRREWDCGFVDGVQTSTCALKHVRRQAKGNVRSLSPCSSASAQLGADLRVRVCPRDPGCPEAFGSPEWHARESPSGRENGWVRLYWDAESGRSLRTECDGNAKVIGFGVGDDENVLHCVHAHAHVSSEITISPS